MPAKPKPSPIGSNNLDFCRCFLALLVIFSHSFALAVGDELKEPLGVLTQHQLNSGQFSVRCFFAISGFLIAHSWLQSRTVKSFLWKRILRIYPGFIAVNLLTYFVVGPVFTPAPELKGTKPWMIVVNLLLLRRLDSPGAFPDNPYPGVMNGSLWSIPYEFKCYLILMLIGSLGLLSGPRWRIIALSAGVLVSGVAYSYAPVNAFEKGIFTAIVGVGLQWSTILAYLLAGTTFYVLRDRIRFSMPIVLTAIGASAIACVTPPLGQIVFPITVTYLLFWIAFHPLIQLHHWAKYGDFSYGIYLYAFPIQQIIALKFPGISPIGMFLLAAPLSTVAGILSWHIIEKRFLRSKKHMPAIQEMKRSPELVG